ncbi:MAG: hypothetical protein IJG45_03020 [Oscillospiraceae bacterium]|nr:hypothetical protein [Oscillospiraceae bacterium]
MGVKSGSEIHESRHEFIPPPEKRHKKRVKFKKGQQALLAAALLAGVLALTPVGRTLPPPDNASPPVQPTELTELTPAPTEATEPIITVEPPEAELYPVMIASEFTGVILLPEAERVLGVTVSVWEKTQERLLTEGEVPEEIYRTGSIPLPAWSFWDDYMEHADEYTGSMFDEGTDYLQELRVALRYDGGDGELQTAEYAAVAMEDNVFYWLWSASEYDELYGTAVAQPDCVSLIYMVESMDYEVERPTVLLGEPELVTDNSAVSVRAEIDGTPVEGVFLTYEGQMPIIHIPIPEGMERDAGHFYRLYVTKYVEGYGKVIEFVTEDDF